MTDLLAILDDVFAPEHAPRSLWDFARSLRLPVDGGRFGGDRYDPESHPAQCELLRALSGQPHTWARVVGLGPVQDGKSWVLAVIPALHGLLELRTALAIVMPTRDKLNTLWQAKILPAIHGNDLGHLLPSDGSGSEGATPHEILMTSGGRGYLLSTGTSNEAGLSSITVRTVIASEVDDIQPAGRLDKAWARADHWQEQALRIEDSTIKHDDPRRSRILRDYHEGTASRLWFACPDCQRFQTWDWSRVTYDPTDDTTATDTARIACAHCGVMHDDAARKRSLLTYRLVHHTQTVSDDGQVIGPAPRTQVFSLRWTALDSPLRSLAELCTRHRTAVRARDADGDHDKLRQFHRDQLAEPYTGDQGGAEGTPRLTAPFLAARSHAHGWAPSTPDKDQHGLYSRHIADLPAHARRSVVTIDVQINRVYWLLTAEDDQRCTYDVAWGYEYANPAQQPWTPAELHEIFDRVATLVEDLAGHTITVARGIDVGFSQDHILPWLQRHPGWLPVAGVGDEIAQAMRRNAAKGLPGVVYLHAPKDWGLPGRLLHSIDVQRVRERALNAYLVQPGKPGAAHLPRGLATNDVYIRHLTALELIEQANGHRTWKKAKGGGRHDYLDCRTYACALFDLANHRARLPPPPHRRTGRIGSVGSSPE